MKGNSKQRSAIPIGIKREIYKLYRSQPSLSQKEIAERINDKYQKKLNIDRSTVSKILKKSETILDTKHSSNASRIYPTQCPKLEEALFMWLQSARLQNITVSDDLLIEQAKSLADVCEVPNDFKFSPGFLLRFKKRHNISKHTSAVAVQLA